jgi:hypothetical protein
MGTITTEKIKDASLSPQQQHEVIITSADKNLVDILGNSDEVVDVLGHLKYFIDKDDENDPET